MHHPTQDLERIAHLVMAADFFSLYLSSPLPLCSTLYNCENSFLWDDAYKITLAVNGKD